MLCVGNEGAQGGGGGGGILPWIGGGCGDDGGCGTAIPVEVEATVSVFIGGTPTTYSWGCACKLLCVWYDPPTLENGCFGSTIRKMKNKIIHR